MWTIFSTYDYLMIVYPVYAFHDHWPFCFVIMATLNLKKKNPPKPLKQKDSDFVHVIWVRATENSLTSANLSLGLVVMATENSHRIIWEMVELHFLHNHWNDVNHIWQLWSLDDCLSRLCVLWPEKILFGCHGNIKLKKKNKWIF